MRDQWYGDNRDLVKWGVLVTLAADHAIRRILQVAYFRPSEWGSLEIDGLRRPLPEAVVRHFRDVRNIGGLAGGPRIEVLAMPFADRKKYNEALREAVSNRPEAEACLVFLDPDTGLAPRAAGLEHVLDSEVTKVWKYMPPGDVLAFYQHQTNRNGTPWIEQKREQFEKALGLLPRTVKLATGMTIARDVAFFYCRKPAA